MLLRPVTTRRRPHRQLVERGNCCGKSTDAARVMQKSVNDCFSKIVTLFCRSPRPFPRRVCASFSVQQLMAGASRSHGRFER